MRQSKPRQRPGPDPELLKVEGDPLRQFQKLLRPSPDKEPAKPREQGKRGR